MKIMMRLTIALLVIGMNGVCAAELRIWTVEEPPSSFTDEQEGKKAITGFAVEIVREVQRKLGDATPIQIMPEARVYQLALTEPNIVLFSISRTPARETTFHWISLIMRKPWVFYAKKNAGVRINSIEDLKQVKAIGVVRGDVRASWLQEQGLTNVEEVTQHEQNLRKLMADRVQLIFYEPQGLAYLCKQLGYDVTTLEPVFIPYVSEVYIAMSKPGTPLETVKQWQAAAQQLKTDGTFQQIGEKWTKYIRERYGIVAEVKDGALNF